MVKVLVVEQGGEAMTEQVLDLLCIVHKANSVNKAFKNMKAGRIAKERKKLATRGRRETSKGKIRKRNALGSVNK